MFILFIAKNITIIVSLGIPFGKDEYVPIERFSADGMISGMVGACLSRNYLIVCYIGSESILKGDYYDY